MKLLATLGKLVGLALIAAFILIGVDNPAGQAIVEPLGDATQATGRAISTNLPAIPTDGFSSETWTAIGISSLVVAAVLLVGGPNLTTYRSRLLIGVGGVLLAVTLATTNILG